MFDGNILNQFSGTINHIMFFILIINVLVHIIFAAGVARDVGHLHKVNINTQIAPGFAWVLGTLIGGIFIGVAYWVMHHSSLARR